MAVSLAVAAATGACADAQRTPQKLPPGFVALSAVDPTIIQEIRYFTPHNFTGRPVDGYQQPMCILTRAAADALHKVQLKLRDQGYSLKVYDCYRPQRSVNSFVAWAKNLSEQQMKSEFYMQVDKSNLFHDGYLAEKSSHSRGSTMDLTLVKLPAPSPPPYHPGQLLVPCYAPMGERFPDTGIDMGTGFDCFDTLAHTLDPRVQGQARENRMLLKNAMEETGFTNLSVEWWHFTLNNEPFPDTYFDFPVAQDSLPASSQPL